MKICDAHTDFLTEIKSIDKREIYVKKICKISKFISCAVFTTNSILTIKDVENFKKELNYYNKKYKTELMLSIEDLGIIKTVDELKQLINLKPVSITLTWNYKNQYAGGAFADSGITNLGKQAIKLIEDNNIFVDTAHLSKRAFWQFFKITNKPIYNSHSNIYSLCKHKRNLTDKQIKAIVDSNGFLGITIYKNFISNKLIFCKDVALQFDYLIKKFGYKNFGLGTDLYGIDKTGLPINFKNYFDVTNLIKELKNLKYSKKIINAIIYKNYKNFLKNNKNNQK